MALFKRIRDITAASINELLDKAEDPVKMLNQFLRDMEEDIAEVEIAVAKQIAVEKRFHQQLTEAQELADKRAQQAEKALEAGNEELARRALADKKEHQMRADEMKTQWESAKTTSESLKVKLLNMKDEFVKMKNRREILVARADAARVQKQINQVMTGFGTDNAAKGFKRMEDKVMQMEAEADASNELAGTGTDIDKEIKELEKDDVEDELAALKAKIAAKKSV